MPARPAGQVALPIQVQLEPRRQSAVVRLPAADRARLRLQADSSTVSCSSTALSTRFPPPTGGTKFWRVRSFQGVIDTAPTAAVTAWSPVFGAFVVPDGPLRVNSISLSRAAPRRRPGSISPCQQRRSRRRGDDQSRQLERAGGTPPLPPSCSLLALLRDLPLRHRAGGRADDGEPRRRRSASVSTTMSLPHRQSVVACRASTACRSARTAASHWERS